jgi:hypothetical protein
MDVWNPSRAIVPCNDGSGMRSRCLPPAFLCHMRITIAFNYLAPIIAPVAIEAARLDAHNIWVNMCGCGAKKRVHYDFVGGSMPIMHVYTTKVNVVTILRPTPMFLQASYLGL